MVGTLGAEGRSAAPACHQRFDRFLYPADVLRLLTGKAADEYTNARGKGDQPLALRLPEGDPDRSAADRSFRSQAINGELDPRLELAEEIRAGAASNTTVG
jgi:hypothetical protein